TWSLADSSEAIAMRPMQGTRVEHVMTTDLFTVNEEELVELGACLMDWQKIRHVLVEDKQHKLVGLVTHRNLLRYLSDHGSTRHGEEGVPVKNIMVRNPISVPPETFTADAIQMMRDRKISALPVVREDQRVGSITERDCFRIAG
ncbi:MAG: CBS domain-containing protein, partial [Rhodothermales bacterium]|nr:CBS domain-containing protein [Rhodothermales bacterium]